MGAGFGNSLAGDWVALTAVLAVAVVVLLSLLSLRRRAREEASSRRRLTELEIRLNEAEAAGGWSAFPDCDGTRNGDFIAEWQTGI